MLLEWFSLAGTNKTIRAGVHMEGAKTNAAFQLGFSSRKVRNLAVVSRHFTEKRSH